MRDTSYCSSLANALIKFKWANSEPFRPELDSIFLRI